ncbi:hypothetical protein SDC9_58595 [bioreactor metagenome]|uniref:Flavodoxin domain-containing protein n=1 Tax=bioreactor metagenome TaxID=1076179 RepID=A0A644XDI1_9ZZZZ
MSTLIAYASKYGFTENCAKELASKLDGRVDVVNLGVKRPGLEAYDTVIIGGSVYAGKIRKPVRRFCAQNLDRLTKKRLGLFICGLAEGADADRQLQTVFPKELLAAAAATGFFGGECSFEKMNFFEKTVMKKFMGSADNILRISEERVTRFAEQLNIKA